MAVLVISGSGRGAGKTAVGCALIAAMPELRWTAVKVTPHRHEISGTEGVWEETDRDSEKDTGRLLAAGAERAFLILERHDGAGGASLESKLGEVRPSRDINSLLVESNRVTPAAIASVGEPAICLAVAAGPESVWKPSLPPMLRRVHALVLTGGLPQEELSPELNEIPRFRLPADRWVSPELLAFVRASLKLECPERAALAKGFR